MCDSVSQSDVLKSPCVTVSTKSSLFINRPSHSTNPSQSSSFITTKSELQHQLELEHLQMHIKFTHSIPRASQECYRTSDPRFHVERGTSVCLSLQSLTLKDLSLAGRSHPITCWRDPGPEKFHNVGPLEQGLRPPMISLALSLPAPTAIRKNTVRISCLEVACVRSE